MIIPIIEFGLCVVELRNFRAPNYHFMSLSRACLHLIKQDGTPAWNTKLKRLRDDSISERYDDISNTPFNKLLDSTKL